MTNEKSDVQGIHFMLPNQSKASAGEVKNCTLPLVTTWSFGGYKMLFDRFLFWSLSLMALNATLCFLMAAEKSGKWKSGYHCRLSHPKSKQNEVGLFIQVMQKFQQDRMGRWPQRQKD